MHTEWTMILEPLANVEEVNSHLKRGYEPFSTVLLEDSGWNVLLKKMTFVKDPEEDTVGD